MSHKVIPFVRMPPDVQPISWRQQAADRWNFGLWFWQRWWLKLGGHVRHKLEQLTLDAPKVQTYLFLCPRCKEPEVDYKHGFDEKVYFNCSVCDQPSTTCTPPIPDLAPAV